MEFVSNTQKFVPHDSTLPEPPLGQKVGQKVNQATKNLIPCVNHEPHEIKEGQKNPAAKRPLLNLNRRKVFRPKLFKLPNNRQKSGPNGERLQVLGFNLKEHPKSSQVFEKRMETEMIFKRTPIVYQYGKIKRIPPVHCTVREFLLHHIQTLPQGGIPIISLFTKGGFLREIFVPELYSAESTADIDIELPIAYDPNFFQSQLNWFYYSCGLFFYNKLMNKNLPPYVKQELRKIFQINPYNFYQLYLPADIFKPVIQLEPPNPICVLRVFFDERLDFVISWIQSGPSCISYQDKPRADILRTLTCNEPIYFFQPQEEIFKSFDCIEANRFELDAETIAIVPSDPRRLFELAKMMTQNLTDIDPKSAEITLLGFSFSCEHNPNFFEYKLLDYIKNHVKGVERQIPFLLHLYQFVLNLEINQSYEEHKRIILNELSKIIHFPNEEQKANFINIWLCILFWRAQIKENQEFPYSEGELPLRLFDDNKNSFTLFPIRTLKKRIDSSVLTFLLSASDQLHNIISAIATLEKVHHSFIHTGLTLFLEQKIEDALEESIKNNSTNLIEPFWQHSYFHKLLSSNSSRKIHKLLQTTQWGKEALFCAYLLSFSNMNDLNPKEMSSLFEQLEELNLNPSQFQQLDQRINGQLLFLNYQNIATLYKLNAKLQKRELISFNELFTFLEKNIQNEAHLFSLVKTFNSNEFSYWALPYLQKHFPFEKLSFHQQLNWLGIAFQQKNEELILLWQIHLQKLPLTPMQAEEGMRSLLALYDDVNELILHHFDLFVFFRERYGQEYLFDHEKVRYIALIERFSQIAPSSLKAKFLNIAHRDIISLKLHDLLCDHETLCELLKLKPNIHILALYIKIYCEDKKITPTEFKEFTAYLTLEIEQAHTLAWLIKFFSDRYFSRCAFDIASKKNRVMPLLQLFCNEWSLTKLEFKALFDYKDRFDPGNRELPSLLSLIELAQQQPDGINEWIESDAFLLVDSHERCEKISQLVKQIKNPKYVAKLLLEIGNHLLKNILEENKGKADLTVVEHILKLLFEKKGKFIPLKKEVIALFSAYQAKAVEIDPEFIPNLKPKNENDFSLTALSNAYQLDFAEIQEVKLHLFTITSQGSLSQHRFSLDFWNEEKKEILSSPSLYQAYVEVIFVTLKIQRNRGGEDYYYKAVPRRQRVEYELFIQEALQGLFAIACTRSLSEIIDPKSTLNENISQVLTICYQSTPLLYAFIDRFLKPLTKYLSDQQSPLEIRNQYINNLYLPLINSLLNHLQKHQEIKHWKKVIDLLLEAIDFSSSSKEIRSLYFSAINEHLNLQLTPQLRFINFMEYDLKRKGGIYLENDMDYLLNDLIQTPIQSLKPISDKEMINIIFFYLILSLRENKEWSERLKRSDLFQHSLKHCSIDIHLFTEDPITEENFENFFAYLSLFPEYYSLLAELFSMTKKTIDNSSSIRKFLLQLSTEPLIESSIDILSKKIPSLHEDERFIHKMKQEVIKAFFNTSDIADFDQKMVVFSKIVGANKDSPEVIELIIQSVQYYLELCTKTKEVQDKPYAGIKWLYSQSTSIYSKYSFNDFDLKIKLLNGAIHPLLGMLNPSVTGINPAATYLGYIKQLEIDADKSPPPQRVQRRAEILELKRIALKKIEEWQEDIISCKIEGDLNPESDMHHYKLTQIAATFKASIEQKSTKPAKRKQKKKTYTTSAS